MSVVSVVCRSGMFGSSSFGDYGNGFWGVYNRLPELHAAVKDQSLPKNHRLFHSGGVEVDAISVSQLTSATAK